MSKVPTAKELEQAYMIGVLAASVASRHSGDPIKGDPSYWIRTACKKARKQFPKTTNQHKETP